MPTKKDQYSSPSKKLIALFSLLLFSGQEFSLSRLAALLNCSKQAILRMLNEIDLSNELEVLKRRYNRQMLYRVKIPTKKPNVCLSPDDINRLLLCRDMVVHLLPHDVYDTIGNVIMKSTVLLGDMEDKPKALASIADVSVKGRIDYTHFKEMLDILFQCISGQTVCEVSYQAIGKAEPKSYWFAPTKIIAYRESLYLRGWKVNVSGALTAEHPMLLAVHRLKSVCPLRLSFDLPDPTSETDDMFGLMASEPFKVAATFSAKTATYARERIWSKDQVIEDMEGGGVKITMTARSEEEVISWIMSFGGSAALLEPPTLRKRIREISQKMADTHGE